jgi:chaperonin GroEL (HSP60 family)
LFVFIPQTCAGLEQYAIGKFAECLEAIPRALASNAGVNGTEVISKLYAAHQQGQKNAGFDNEVSSVVVCHKTEFFNANFKKNISLGVWVKMMMIIYDND